MGENEKDVSSAVKQNFDEKFQILLTSFLWNRETLLLLPMFARAQKLKRTT